MHYFDFGDNWQNYSRFAFTPEKFLAAKKSLLIFFKSEQIKSKKVIDIGCGSGIFSLAFLELGATEVTATDINPKCLAATQANYQKSESLKTMNAPLTLIRDDILNSNLSGYFDIVYSWGVLHHTGKMYQAIDACTKLVAPGGFLFIALYNRHWSSPLWRIVKYFYNLSPSFFKKIMIFLFYLPVLLAKCFITRANPWHKTRGMDFYYDLVDWLGGYPYEYASSEEIVNYIVPQGFSLIKSIPAAVPTGCNEFLFMRK